MKKNLKSFRLTLVFMLVIYLNSLVLPGVVLGQSSDCDFDANNPTLESARKNFLGLNYTCAEEEINAFLQSETLTIEQKADAHVLLAEVYYAKVRDDSEKRSKVIAQFVAAFDAYRDWKGELNIRSSEFMAMMKEAQDMVDEEAAQATEEIPADQVTGTEETEPPAVEEAVTAPEKAKKKPWYTKWWAIGLGVGVVAAVVVIVAGGGGEDEDKTLPEFPDTPNSG